MDYVSNAWSIVYYVFYPILYILSLLLYILAIITAPLQHLVHYFAYACWYPVKILVKFETLYIFFGVAVLIGGLTGLSLHYVSTFFISMLDLESHPEEQRGRTLTSYRAEKQARREQRDPLQRLKQQNDLSNDTDALKGEHSAWERLMNRRGETRSRLVPNTILEEDSMDDDSD